jgi:hypothetical protein
MAFRMTKVALAAGLAGAFALVATTASFAAPKPKYPKDWYEARGAKTDVAPPVPGFALNGYKPGLCWKVAPGHGDRQMGSYVPCSQWRKH